MKANTTEGTDDATEAIRNRRVLPVSQDALASDIARLEQVGSSQNTAQFEETQAEISLLKQTKRVVDHSSSSQLQEINFLAPPESSDELGRLGEYRVLQLLGVGGMGMVFRAEDPRLKRQIALKVMKPSNASSQSAKDRFIREAQFNAAIEHDHIVHIYQVGEDRGVPFIAMQYLRGESLKTQIDREGKLKPTEVVRIGKEVAAGLAAAHERGLIHRDIKPDNIWIEEKTHRAKILDFGLVRAAAEDSSLTMAGMVVGTPQYMAPEQALGQSIDHRCDLFSLGAVLYHLVTGKQAFKGANLTATLMAVVHQDPAPLEDLSPSIYPSLSKLVTRLLSKDRNERPQTAAEVGQALAEIEQELKQPATVEHVAVALPAVVAAKPATSSPPIHKPPRKRFAAVAAGGAAALLLLGVIIITITNKDGTKTVFRVPDGVETDVQAAPGSKVTIVQAEEKPPAAMIPPSATMPEMSTEIATEPSAPTLDPIDFAAERKAAEWLASVIKVGDIRLRKEDGALVLVTPAQPALPEGNFTVDSFNVVDNGSLDDVGVAHLSGCRRLIHAAFMCLSTNPKVTIAVLDQLRQSPTLKYLDLSNSAVDDRLWPALSHWPGLETAILDACKLTDQGATTAPRMLNLQTLQIHSTQISDKGLETLANRFPNLTTLHIFEDDGEKLRTLMPLSRFPKLKTVGCSSPQVTEAGVAVLSEHPQLEDLYLVGRTSDATFERLLPLRGQLKSFTLFTNMLSASPPTSLAYAHLAQFSRLEAIALFGQQGSPTDADLTLLAQLPHLKTLNLQFNESSQFPEAPDAKRHYTPDGIAAFRQARPDIELNIDGKHYPSNGWPLAVVKQLDEIDPLPKWELPEGSPLPVVAPIKPEEATALQQQWAEHLQRPVVEEVASPAGLDMKFALIPPGEFRKIFTRSGEAVVEPDMPVRRFRITKPYAISTTEVTWDQFRQFVEATGYQTEAETSGAGGRDRAYQLDPKINWRTPGWKPAPNEPVTQVTPRDAEAFCAWLTDPVGWASSPSVPKAPNTTEDEKKETTEEKKDGLEARPTSAIYRLPTEAEWVHACRAGSVYKHVVGPEPGDLADYAWTQEFLDPNPQASPLHLVAQKKPNSFGLHDTLGNVWEYTRDYLPLALVPYRGTNDPVSYGRGTILGNAWDDAATVHPDWGYVGWTTATMNVGFRVLKQFDAEPLPGPLDRPLVLRAGQPMSVHSLVPRPEKIPGLQSWSVELAGLHTVGTAAIAASPKGDVIATGSNTTGKISLWDRDGNYQRALLGHEGQVNSLDFSSDGRWLASCEYGGGDRGFGGITARVWNVETGALHAVIPFSGWAYKVAFSPISDRLAIAGPFNPLVVLDLRTGQTVSHATGIMGGEPMSVAWSPDGTELASSYGNNHLRVRDSKTLQVLREVEAPATHALEWSPDGKSLAMQGNDGKVAIRDAQTLALTRTIDATLFNLLVHVLAWLPDSKRIAASARDQSGVFDTETGERLIKFNNGTSTIALLDEGQQVVFELNGRLHFYDMSTGKKLREGKERGRSGGSTMLAPKGDQVFASGMGPILRRFDTATGQASESRLQFDVASLAPAPDGTLISAGSQHYGSQMWILNAASGVKLHELSHGDGNVTRVAWSPDGKWLATGATDKLVRVWNVATGKIEHELAGHTGTIRSLAWSPDGTRLASAAEDKTVRLWDPLAGRLVATHDQFPEAMDMRYASGNKFAWSTDSRRLWIALNQNIVPVDVETGTFGPQENFSNGNAVTFLNTSPDDQRLLAREDYGWTFVRGRDAQDRRLLGQHLGQTAQWHPDSRRFLGSEHGYGTVGFDVETNHRLGMLFPWLTGDHWLCLGPTGHYRGSPGVEEQIVYVAMLEDGSQQTYTPAEFAEKFSWKNDPEKAELLGK